LSKKETILRVAAALFSKHGYNNTTMSELSRLTAAAEGTIFYHFANKEELFISVLQNAKDVILGEIEKYLSTRTFESGLAMMQGLVTFYLHMADEMEEQFLLVHRHYPCELATVNAMCRDHFEALYNALLDIFEQAIVLGQQDGSIRNMPARKHAMVLLSMVDGIVRFKTRKIWDTKQLVDELIEILERILKK
jgi:AcrR family transcriptional regulator